MLFRSTEAGDGEDGRIKSAVGIGALLADGIGDTVRVSLSEAPEAEIPVARKLVDYVTARAGAMMIPAQAVDDFDYVHPVRRKTRAVKNIGGDNVPVVIADRMDLAASGELKNFRAHPDLCPDYIYCGRNLPSKEEREEAAYIVDGRRRNHRQPGSVSTCAGAPWGEASARRRRRAARSGCICRQCAVRPSRVRA